MFVLKVAVNDVFTQDKLSAEFTVTFCPRVEIFSSNGQLGQYTPSQNNWYQPVVRNKTSRKDISFIIMHSALDFGASGPGSSPGRGQCVVFLGKTLYSRSASLHPGVSMGTCYLLGKPNKIAGE